MNHWFLCFSLITIHYFSLITTHSVSSFDPPPKPTITLSGAKFAEVGKPLSLNCSIHLKIGPTVFLNWHFPNADVGKRTNTDSQREYIMPDTNLKVNYKILHFFNMSKSDAGNYTCEAEDSHYSSNTANRTYYLNVYDPQETFLEFKIMSDKTSYTQSAGSPKMAWMFNLTSYPAAMVSCKVPNGQVVTTSDSASPNKYQLSLLTPGYVRFVTYNLDFNDTGTFVFTADNGFQKKNVNVSVVVEGK